MKILKPIEYRKVFYERNVALGIAPECYECISHCIDPTGYPRITRNYKNWNMHRWLWQEETGELPEVVMHKCDNRKCINMEHLEAGTYLANNIDRFTKGRGRCGRHFSDEQVITMRLRRATGEKLKDLADDFNTKVQVISWITTGQYYKNVGGPITRRHKRKNV
jgi:hypothetical protein